MIEEREMIEFAIVVVAVVFVMVPVFAGRPVEV